MLKKTDPKNVVVMRTDRIGEVLLSTVAVDAIRNQYPGVKVSFVTSGYSRPVIEDREDVDEIFIVETMDGKGWGGQVLPLAAFLRRKRFDMAVVLNPHKMLHLACFLAGIPVRVGYDRKWGCLLNGKIPDERDRGRKHEVKYTMEVLRLLGIDGDVPAPRLSVSAEAESAVTDLMNAKGTTLEKPLVAIHPGSSNPAKIWSCERYAELVRRISSELDCNVAIVGSKAENCLADRIMEAAGSDVLNLAGELDLKELAAFLKRAALFVGNDSGPMHMAAALDVPVIAIFGRNIPGVSPTRWRPWGGNHAVFHKTPGCTPCSDTVCPHGRKCLKAITVDEVFEAAKSTLNRKKGLKSEV